MVTGSNQDIQLARDFVQYTNRSIFLTGKAGTGKTTFLKDLKLTSPKRMIVVAPTGVAAINAGGVTIHSFFQLPFHPYIPSFYLSDYNTAVSADRNDPPGYKMSREKINIIKGLDLLIIDEISMVRADTLDAIDSSLRRYRDRYKPFGGVQLLMIGDLQQLAPVVKDEDSEILSNYYDSYFFFGSKALSSTDYVTIELKHIYRQDDRVFINLLNKIRENDVDQEVLTELNKRYIPDFDPESGTGYITLTTHNHQAREINGTKLDKLPGKIHSFTATIEDQFPEFAYPNDTELVLKSGAQVMFVKNDISRDRLFFNGKIGKIKSFEDDIIVVKCPEDDFNIRVEKAEWQNMKYSLNEETKEIEETVIGTFTQYPLKLAWAITIHKSQGLTFDRAVIDACAAFAHGQVYVALSRCRTLDGIVLTSRINRQSIIDNPQISGFVNGPSQIRPDRTLFTESKNAYQQQLLTELFGFSSLMNKVNYCLKLVNEHKDKILGNLDEKLEGVLSAVRSDLFEVSEKFQTQLDNLLKLNPDAESNILLQERIKKAAVYFSDKLEDDLKEILTGLAVETDNKTVRRSLTEALERTRKEGIIKLACLNAVRQGFETGRYLDVRAKSAINIPAVSIRAPKLLEDSSGVIKYPELLSRLKEWRNDKAKEMNLPHYMILPQKTMVSLVNFLPQSLQTLKQIRGIGKKKTEKYGEELLDLIVSYCTEKNITAPDLKIIEKKKEKQPKEDTKKISYNLFREGKTIEQIAGERVLSISTIEGHLAYCVKRGEIPVSKFVSQEITDLITCQFEGTEEFKMGPVKIALGDRVSWSDIRFVLSHLIFLKSKADNQNEE
ncbi:MAG: AAA family ATPase [Bacteroidetes bacterium]|nr:AAA family ATPase [Bacteroidota bacterium]